MLRRINVPASFLIAVGLFLSSSSCRQTTPIVSQDLLLTVSVTAAKGGGVDPDPNETRLSTSEPAVATVTASITTIPSDGLDLTTELPSTTPTILTRFAVIGDYGLAGDPERDVSNLIKGWKPDFIVTTGDNNYPDGKAETIDENIGQYFQEYIFPYSGEYGVGGNINRFFPTLGRGITILFGALSISLRSIVIVGNLMG